MYTRSQKFVLGSFFVKTVFFVAAAGMAMKYYEAPHPSGLGFCQLQVLPKTKQSQERWVDFEKWCKDNVHQEETTWTQSAYLWWTRNAVEKCHAYTTCTSYSSWTLVGILAVGFIVYADYLIHVLAINSFMGQKGGKTQHGIKQGICRIMFSR